MNEAGELTSVAVIGAGAFAHRAHLPAISRRTDIRRRWIVTATDDHARRAAADWQYERYSTNLDDPLADESVDAVDICLPVQQHAEVATKALEAGKHVLVEKPLALSVRDAQLVLDAARTSGKQLMVAENWYFASAFRKAHRAVTNGVIGNPYLLRARHQSGYRIPPSNPDPGVGWLTSAGTHVISASRHLVGEFSTVFAASPQQLLAPGKPVVENDLALVATFESGCVGSLDFTGRSRHVGERQLAFSLFGEEGLIEFDVWAGWFKWSTAAGEVQEVDRSPSMGFDEELDHFLNCVRMGSQPIPDATDQIRTIAVLEAAYRSLGSGQAQSVSVPANEPTELADAAQNRR